MNRNLMKIAAILSLSVSIGAIGQPAFAKTSFTSLKTGMKGSKVQEVENMLNVLKFDYKLKVDKFYDKHTAYNVKRFQKSVKLKQTGIVNKLTYDKLKKVYTSKKKTSEAPSSTLKLGSTGQKVKSLQQDLKALGYHVTINSHFDASTRLAVMIFQKNSSLKMTGEADSKTLAAIAQKAKEQSSKAGQETNPTAPSTPVTPSAPSTPEQSQHSNSGQSSEEKLPAGLTAEEKEMIQMVNQERTRRGLNALEVDMDLVKVARVKGQDMVNNHYFSHTSPTYGSPFTMMETFGIKYRAAAENIAQNRSVSLAHSSFMNSSGHKANILNSTYSHVGIAVVDGGPYGKTFVQMFMKY